MKEGLTTIIIQINWLSLLALIALYMHYYVLFKPQATLGSLLVYNILNIHRNKNFPSDIN